MKSITARFSTRTVGTVAVAVLAALLGVLVLTGCGSSNAASQGSTTAATTTTTTTSTTTTGTAGSAAATLQAYQSCLKSHGVDLPQGGFRGNGGAGGAPPTGGAGAPPTGSTGTAPSGRPGVTAAQQKAFTACASLRPAGGFGGGFAGAPGGNTNNAAFAKFQSCLKQHGVDPTDANARGSSDFQTAMSACRSLLPNGGTGGGFGGGGTPPAGGGAGAGGQGNPSSFARFQACLRSHGVDPTAPGGQSAKTQAALNACQKLLSEGGTSSSSTTTTG